MWKYCFQAISSLDREFAERLRQAKEDQSDDAIRELLEKHYQEREKLKENLDTEKRKHNEILQQKLLSRNRNSVRGMVGNQAKRDGDITDDRNHSSAANKRRDRSDTFTKDEDLESVKSESQNDDDSHRNSTRSNSGDAILAEENCSADADGSRHRSGTFTKDEDSEHDAEVGRNEDSRDTDESDEKDPPLQREGTFTKDQHNTALSVLGEEDEEEEGEEKRHATDDEISVGKEEVCYKTHFVCCR